MAFLSDLMSRPVADINGEKVGEMVDLIACTHMELPHPVVMAIVVKTTAKKTVIISCTEVAVLLGPAVSLTLPQSEINPYQPCEDDLYLVRDILDKQIIDTDGVRVVRVNDLDLTRVGGTFYVANVDISAKGLFRRLGLKRLARPEGHTVGKSNMISWDDVELLKPSEDMRLKVPADKIADLHPADLAEIISDLNRRQSGDLLESLDLKTLADTLEEVEPEFQASLVESMPDEKVADVLEEMSPDEAADLLAELPKDRSEDLLEMMEGDEAEDVRKLLAYPEDSAGGIMTTDFVSILPNLTAAQAIESLRENPTDAENITYVYVTDKSGRLLGVFSLSDLIRAKPATPVNDFMHIRVVSVNLTDSQDEVAQVVAKYNLLAVPVVDDQGCVHGIVTADDALDKIIPTAWKKRLPRLYH
jgi:CBS domain-containing protein/sporulation protein YlmC with PRC-barrel domain